MSYSGAAVSGTFMKRWRSKEHVGDAAPFCEIKVRRGRLIRSYHDDWPNPQFGQIVGRSIHHQWYPDWTPQSDWVTLDGVASVDLDQSFDKNGITVASIVAENEAWVDTVGHAGMHYHQRQRGYLWPWRGWTPKHRPGSGDSKNAWYNKLSNAQILVRQGYGPDTALKTFTGLIDSYSEALRPDRITISARDFGSVLADCDLFGWNKDKTVNDPVTFIPHDYKRLKLTEKDARQHRWIKIKDVTDIVRCMLRWAGFKEWEIENSGVDLSLPFSVDKSKTYMDVINDIKAQLGYVFFIAEPRNDNDRSIGVPIFRRASVLVPQRSQPIMLRDGDMLTDIAPQHDNRDDRAIIRVRGVPNKKIGRYLDNPPWGGDSSSDILKRVTFQYWPPWLKTASGVIKQLTYYNIGDTSAAGFKTKQDVVVACVMIAVQIALARDTATVQCPGQPALGLDSFAYCTDAGTGIASRLYVTNRKSTMRRDGNTQSQLLWASELGGSLCDNPEFEHVVTDYQRAIKGLPVISWAPKGWD